VAALRPQPGRTRSRERLGQAFGDRGQALEAVREAARNAIVEALRPMIAAAEAEREAAQRERAEMVRKAR
jgi:hypothetical protein